MGDSMSPLALRFLLTRFGLSSGLRTYPYCPFSPCAGFFCSTIWAILASSLVAFFL